MGELSESLAIVEQIVRAAGKSIMDVYGRAERGVEFKSENNPVTDADKAANEIIVRALSQHFPGDGIVAEESVDAAQALSSSRVWFVDPLDGTKEFIARNGEFSVMLGLAIDGASRLGAVYQPTEDKLYLGVLEADGARRALLRTGEGERALSVSEREERSSLRLAVSRSHRGGTIDKLIAQFGIGEVISSGSVGLKVGLLAERRADLYVHLTDRSSLWDSCGPEAILKAAGGRFTRADGSAYDYRTTDMRTRGGILASNARAYEGVLPSVREAAQASGLLDRMAPQAPVAPAS